MLSFLANAERESLSCPVWGAGSRTSCFASSPLLSVRTCRLGVHGWWVCSRAAATWMHCWVHQRAPLRLSQKEIWEFEGLYGSDRL